MTKHSSVLSQKNSQALPSAIKTAANTFARVAIKSALHLDQNVVRQTQLDANEMSPSILNIAANEGLTAAFWRPFYLPRSAWLEHIPFAFWLISQHKPRSLVEFGTHYGASYLAFCQAIESLTINARCYAVDTWLGDQHSGLYGEEVYISVNARNKALYSNLSSLIRATFSQTAQYFADSSVDLLHIDGLHTQEAVQTDIDTWLPKLSERAVLLLHDTNVRERNFGVAGVFAQLRQKYPVFEFSHGHGLGVVGISECQSQAVQDLLNLDEKCLSHRQISNFFARLGRACADAYQVAEMERKCVLDRTDRINGAAALSK